MEKKFLKVVEIRNDMYLCEKTLEEYSDRYVWECGFIDETNRLLALFAKQSDYSDFDCYCRHFHWTTCHYGKWGRIGVKNPKFSHYELIDDFDLDDYFSDKNELIKEIRKLTRNLDAFVDGQGRWISVSDFPNKQSFRKRFIKDLLKADNVYVYECEPSQFA